MTLATGRQGTGKTTFLLRYLVAEKSITCRFIFDPRGDMGDRLGLPHAENGDELECAIDDGFVLYDPALMFPGNPDAGFEWFAAWSYGRACKLPGKKTLLIDEVWKHCSPNSIPISLAQWIQDGRKYGLHPMFATQMPNRLNGAITNELTELVCFRLQERNALDSVSRLGADAEEVLSLPMGAFVSLNLETGGELRGRLW